MAEFVDPFASLAGGVERGLNIALTVSQVREQKAARERELALKAADSKLELARTMKNDKTTMMGLIQSAANDYQKAGVDVPKFDPKAFEQKGADKQLAKALDTWAKNTKSGAWDPEFGRKWLIAQGARIGESGEEVSAVTEHAWKEALKVGENKKRVDPFVFDRLAGQMGLSPEEAVKLRTSRPEFLDVPFEQLEAVAKAEGERTKQEKVKEGAVSQANRIIGKVDQAMSKVGATTAGLGAKTAIIPGSTAKDLAADLQTIKANLGFAELQAMRQASPTGGALGQVAVQELENLQATVASLDQSQSPTQLKKRLTEVKVHYENWRNAVSGKTPTFESIEEAEKAKLTPGLSIIVGGRPAIWE